MSRPPVTFFCPQPDELERIGGPPVDETVHHWEIPQPARMRAWIIQTVLRLREADYTVSIQPTLPDQGIVVLLPEPHMLKAFHRQFEKKHRDLLIVTIRADVEGFRSPLADAEIVQNGYFADEKRVFHVPHWPQPGLIPRNPERGAKIQTLAFKGDKGNLHPNLFTDAFFDFLDARDIDIRIEETADRTVPQPWHNFEDVDLLLAIRKPWHEGDLFYNKPASKLINAWHAGVPALLGPEYAFRELRRDPLDYFEIADDKDAMEAIDRLLEEPDLYQAVVEHGQSRAEAFTVERITERWADVLFKKIPIIMGTSSYRISRKMPLSLRRGFNVLAMPPAPHEAWKMGGFVYRMFRRYFTS